MGLPAGLSSCPKTKTTQEWVWRNIPAFIRTKDGPQGVQTSTPRTINCGLFWRTWLANSITTWAV